MCQQLIEKIDFYFDETGYMVFTEKYHVDKGFCCGHGCKHCPFNFESVPEPRRTELLIEKQNTKSVSSFE